MKYLKYFEKSLKPLEIGMMYEHFDTPVCYIGHNDGSGYPLLALLMRDDPYRDGFSFIEWVKWMENEKQLPPLNMTIEEYIIKNKLIDKTLISCANVRFSSGGCKDSLIKISLFLRRLLDNKDIQEALPLEREYYEILDNTKKYNL